MGRKPACILFCVLLFLVRSQLSFAQETASKNQPSIGRRGTFYLSILSPYPATFGLGLTHYFGDYFGAMVELGKGTTVVYAGGVKLRPASGKVSPILGLNASLAEEVVGSQRGNFYANTGLDWKWDNGMFLHVGLNWTITRKDDLTEMKPYLQIGIHY